MIDKRLRNWAENNNNTIINDCQYGFCKQRSTVDCIFILSPIINKVFKQEKKNEFCSFIDFKKAFDLVYRNGIWHKLLFYCVSSKIDKMLRAIHEKVQSCVRTNGNYSDFFDSIAGVKQGEPLSPLLYILFINMYENIIVQDNDTFGIDDLRIFILLYADDTVLLSYTPDGLQILLNQLHSYCNKWGIRVNAEKSVVMVFKQGNHTENANLFYDGKLFKVVTKFNHLGVNRSSNGNFYQRKSYCLIRLTKRCIRYSHSLIKLKLTQETNVNFIQ